MPGDDIDRYEQEADDHRRALARTLDRLGDTFSPERLSRQAENFAGEMGHQVWHSARQNPASLALAGAGLALLFAGAARRDENDGKLPPPASTAPDPAMKSPGTIRRSVKLRRAINRGLDRLPDSARARVIRAREAAISAQEAVERKALRAGGASRRAVQREPVLVGAAAFGLGALAAAFLPGTRAEDRVLGDRRDALMAEADRVLEREVTRLRSSLAGTNGAGPHPADRSDRPMHEARHH